MSDDENICPDCGAPWDDHEFAVPSPICPTKTAAKSEQPTSDTPIDPFSKCIQAYFSDPHHGPATSEMLNCASTFWLAGFAESKAELAAAKAENEALKRDVDMKMRDAINANEHAAKALAENAELRKRPTITLEELHAYFLSCHSQNPIAAQLEMQSVAAFLEQQRRKKG